MGACCSHPEVDQTNFQVRRSGPVSESSIQGPSPAVDASTPLAVSLLGRTYPDVLTDKYILGPVLGRGKYGVTRLVTCKSDGSEWACKAVLKADYIRYGKQELPRQELQMMEFLAGSPHTLVVREALEDQRRIYFIMERCTGGDLVDLLCRAGHYTEAAAARCIRDVLTAVAYMHDMGVLHRDIKLENFLYTKDPAEGGRLKVIDYGLAAFYHPGQRFSEVVGTAYYMPPEMCQCMHDQNATYDEAIDVWAVGVILYMLLAGEPPFPGLLDDDVFEAVLHRPPNLYEGMWSGISKEAKSLLEVMLNPDPSQRPTPRALLRHPWLAPGGASEERTLEPEVIGRLKRFATTSRLKRAAMRVLTQHTSEDELAGLRQLFLWLDTNQDGRLSVAELRRGLALQLSDKPLTQQQSNPFKRLSGLVGEGVLRSAPSQLCPALGADLAELLSAADLDGDGEISWEEFMTAMMRPDKLQQDEQIAKVFQAFDKNGDGRLSIQELQEALLLGTCGSSGHHTPPPSVQQQQQQQPGLVSDRDAIPSSTPDRGQAGTNGSAAGAVSSISWAAPAGAPADSGLAPTTSFQSIDPQEEHKILEESINILRSVAQDQDGYIGYDDFVVMMRAGSTTDQSRRKAALRRRSLSVPSAAPPRLQPPTTQQQQQQDGGSYKQQQQQQMLPHVVRAAA